MSKKQRSNSMNNRYKNTVETASKFEVQSGEKQEFEPLSLILSLFL